MQPLDFRQFIISHNSALLLTFKVVTLQSLISHAVSSPMYVFQSIKAIHPSSISVCHRKIIRTHHICP